MRIWKGTSEKLRSELETHKGTSQQLSGIISVDRLLQNHLPSFTDEILVLHSRWQEEVIKRKCICE